MLAGLAPDGLEHAAPVILGAGSDRRLDTEMPDKLAGESVGIPHFGRGGRPVLFQMGSRCHSARVLVLGPFRSVTVTAEAQLAQFSDPNLDI